MPSISELPMPTELTGNELLVVVQDGETRQVALSAALIARHPVSLSNARWLKSGSTILNSRTVELQINVNGGC